MSSFSGQLISIILHGGLLAWLIQYAEVPQVYFTGQGLTLELIEGEKNLGNHAETSEGTSLSEVAADEEPQELEVQEPDEFPTAPEVASAAESLLETTGDPEGIRDIKELEQIPGNIPPTYPVVDRLKRREGTVVLVAHVSREGKVEEVRVEKSTGSFTMVQESIRAFSEFAFVKDQAGWVRYTVVFTLVGAEETTSGG